MGNQVANPIGGQNPVLWLDLASQYRPYPNFETSVRPQTR